MGKQSVIPVDTGIEEVSKEVLDEKVAKHLG